MFKGYTITFKDGGLFELLPSFRTLEYKGY